MMSSTCCYLWLSKWICKWIYYLDYLSIK